MPKDQRGKGDVALDALIEGVEVTERGLEQALSKFGVRRIEAKGQKFDPALHQAMFEVDPGDNPPGTVAEEVQAGLRNRRAGAAAVAGRRLQAPRQAAAPPAAEAVEAEKPAEADKPTEA